MFVFWTLATLMTLLALAFVLVPLLRSRTFSGPSAHEVALAALRGQRHEIDSDIATGNLPADARAEALAELVERAGQDLEPAPKGPSAPHLEPARKPWLAAIALGIAIPALAFGIYAATGTPAATDLKALARHAPADDKQIVGMVESLARKVRERPDDAQGWALLARSMAALGRFGESAEAYETLAKLVPEDPQVLADWADVLGMAQGRTLAGRPRELAMKALEINPTHPKALALAGTAELDAGNFGAAIAHWQRLHDSVAKGSPDAEEAAAVIAEIRDRAAKAGKPVSEVASRPATATATAGAGKTISGSVELAFAIAGKLTGKETLFIFARSEAGARVPLAVVRASARELPMTFTLDDSQAMSPGMNISSAQSVRVEARISRSGNATPQPGDLVGSSAVVRPGARGVKVIVDKVLP